LQLAGRIMTPPGDPRSETILLVEDEPAVRRLVAASLERAGYHVLEARDGAEGLALFDTHADAVDLLITDLRMPEMDGQSLVRELRDRAPALRVLCVSGYPGSAIDLTLTEHFLAKPFSKYELLLTVRKVLDRQS
jgi:two-component system cell cycle sensor histidine kinase/response regulator CckA